MLVSIVIPVHAGEKALPRLLSDLPARAGLEIIVSSADRSGAGADGRALCAARPDCVWIDSAPGRGVQLNAGAARATGRWLWFLHADSRVPDHWEACFQVLDATPAIVGGSFAFRLDSPAWQARVLEGGVAWRVRLLGLPYGDQGVFVRRGVFQQMGGFAEIPLMEDVEFIRRLKRQGPLRHLNVYLTTSARRWEREGWWRRSALNLGLLTLYLIGASPDWLARRYYRT